MAEERWSWKVSDPGANPELNLRYEPGNWGDVLKGIWAAAAVRALLAAAPPEGGALRYLDPFAGAPTYPLLPAASRRLREAPCPELRRLQDPFAREGRLASTASLVLAAADEAGATAAAEVYDADPDRRAAWGEEPVEVVEAASGEAALEAAAGEHDLVLVDPYDLFDGWGHVLPRALPAAGGGALLLYLYNKAPRSAGHHAQYQALRRRLEEARADWPRPAQLLVGRVPADAVLPRAFHEMLLLAPSPVAAALAPELEAATRDLTQHVACAGAFERSPLDEA